jgi:hypothetical protein
MLASQLYRQRQQRLVDPTFRPGVTIRALFATRLSLRRDHIRGNNGIFAQGDAGNARVGGPTKLDRSSRTTTPGGTRPTSARRFSSLPITRPNTETFHIV